MALIACDIETGALPDEDLLRLYDPPEMPGQFDPAAVDIGRATKKETVERKIAEARVEHNAMVADWPSFCEQHQSEWLATMAKKAALNPRAGRVLAIGYMFSDAAAEPLYLAGGDETTLLAGWWSLMELHVGARYVFHNGFGFDLPFLVRRSWLLDISVPEWVLSIRGSKVYFNHDVFLDTSIAWCMGRYNEFISLNDLAKTFGIEGKLKGCTGADFDRLFHGTEDERKLALEYLAQDVRITMAIAKLMGMT
jgi:hypothetical protein